MSKPEVYVSVDIETDGPVAGINNMLSFGAVAYLDGKQISAYYSTVERRNEFKADDSTMLWWEQGKAQYKAATTDARSAEVVMPEFRDWLKQLPGQPIFVGTPAAWDFSFIWYYLNRFAGECPFGHRALDIRSYIMGALGAQFLDKNSKTLYRQWRTYNANPEHHALEDAQEQGIVFCNAQKYIADLHADREAVA